MRSDLIAKERLKHMNESEELNCSQEELLQLKDEISSLVGRYFNISPELFDIRITLKQDKKRE